MTHTSSEASNSTEAASPWKFESTPISRRNEAGLLIASPAPPSGACPRAGSRLHPLGHRGIDLGAQRFLVFVVDVRDALRGSPSQRRRDDLAIPRVVIVDHGDNAAADEAVRLE